MGGQTCAPGKASPPVMEEAGLGRIDELMAWRMEALSEVFGQTASGTAPNTPIHDVLVANNRAYYEREIASGGHVACFASIDGQTVGCGGICLQSEMPSPDNLSGRCAYLMNIYTRPAFRHRGVGRAIVEWLVRRARELGAGKIYLETSGPGRRLYEEVGFEDYPDMMKLPDLGV